MDGSLYGDRTGIPNGICIWGLTTHRRYSHVTTSGYMSSSGNNTIKLADMENVGLAFGILFI